MLLCLLCFVYFGSVSVFLSCLLWIAIAIHDILSVCLTVSLFVYLSIRLFYLTVFDCLFWPVLHLCLSVCLSVNPYIYLTTSLVISILTGSV